jgi:acyl carrier protein
MDYLDFELEIRAGSGRKYPVAVIHSPAGETDGTMDFPFDELVLRNRLQALQIALLQSGGRRRRVLSSEEQTVQDFGRDMFNALVTGEVRSRYDVSLHKAVQQGKGLRLKLRFQAPDLAALPWEFLYDERYGEYLCLSSKTPPVRYLKLPQPIQPLIVTPPLRILGMVASPSDLPQLDVDREMQRVEEAVKELRAERLLELTWLPEQSWRALQRKMRHGPWHVFHFIGHGGFDLNMDEGVIALADEQGRSKLIKATQLGRLLADHYQLRLVVLNSCEGARGSESDIFSSSAAILVRRGIPAVLAMQYEITDRAAIEFSRVFYESLADRYPVDTSVTEARIAVDMAVTNTLEWGTPVLYMRSPDGVLFDLAQMPIPEPPQPEPPQPEPPQPEPPQPEPPQPEPFETDNIAETVFKIVSDQLSVSPNSVHINSTLVYDLGADDLDLDEFLMALEEEFDLEIPDSERQKMEYWTVGDTIRYLIQRLK